LTLRIGKTLTTDLKPIFIDKMKTKTSIVLILFSLVMSVFAAEPTAEQALRAADEQWSKIASTKDVEKTVSFYSNDAVVLPPNAAMVTTNDGIKELWKAFVDGLTAINWKTTHVEVAKSGELGYITGTYEMSGKNGSNDRGKYLEVWKKQADGSWKCGADMFSSDLPAVAEKK
jgi:ketosteroid isomerase-like protein